MRLIVLQHLIPSGGRSYLIDQLWMIVPNHRFTKSNTELRVNYINRALTAKRDHEGLLTI